MYSDDLAIRVEGVSKLYQIYDAPRDRLKQFVLPRFRRAASLPPIQYFREFWALKDISFDVKRGETVGIVGRNGSGKSTLLQIICGTLSPTMGDVWTTGRIAALLELGSGFNPDFSGRDNVYMNAALLGLTKEQVDEKFDDIAAFADIGQFIEQPTKTYSSGMVVRLAFAVQAVINPDIFIVDEALAVGDEKFQRKCFARLDDLKSRGSSILFVSHSPASVIELCDRTLLLDQGRRLLYTNAPKAIKAYQKLIYAPTEQHALLVDEYRAADEQGLDIDQMVQPGEIESELIASDNAFDPGLVPETTMVYPTQGAKIESFEIRDAQDCVVNILNARQPFQLVVSGYFTDDVTQAYFGIHIRSTSGLVITGQRYPEEGRYLGPFSPGQVFQMRFCFNADILPGAYFVGGGVWSKDEPSCLHRIMDAVMFRVTPNAPQYSFGYVDISTDKPKLTLVQG